MNRKVIFLLYQPLSQFNYDRLGFETFIKKGWNVECWIFFGKYYSIFKNKELFYKKSANFYNFKSFLDCIKRLRKLPNNFYFIDGWNNSFIPNIIQQLLILKGGKKISMAFGTPEIKGKALKIFLSQKKSIGSVMWLFFKIIKALLSKLNYKTFNPNPNYLLTSGNLEVKNFNKNRTKIKIINSHSFDYEKYLKLKNKPMNKDLKDSIVYIDQDHEGNYDKILNKANYPVTKDFHWKSLNNFFDQLSKKLNKKIIIAAHHRRDKKINIETNYEIEYSQTANLIKNSSLILAHYSSAISLAILFKKPIVFITTDELENFKYTELHIKKYAQELNNKVININKFNFPENYDFFHFDDNAYKKWKENYIKSPKSQIKSFWFDFIDILENENKMITNL